MLHCTETSSCQSVYDSSANQSDDHTNVDVKKKQGQGASARTHCQNTFTGVGKFCSTTAMDGKHEDDVCITGFVSKLI